MASSSHYATGPQFKGPVWASWLGVISIVFGIFLTASHGNELDETGCHHPFHAGQR